MRMRLLIALFAAVSLTAAAEAKPQKVVPRKPAMANDTKTSALQSEVARLAAIYAKRSNEDRALTMTTLSDIKLAGALTAIPEVTCPKNRLLCFVPVRVKPVVLADGSNGCSVSFEIEKIKVEKSATPAKIFVVWYLDSGTDVANQYRFNPLLGIYIKDAYDPMQDFDQGRPHADRMFHWRSINLNAMPPQLHYDINVERWDDGKGDWSPCTEHDPIIVNTG